MIKLLLFLFIIGFILECKDVILHIAGIIIKAIIGIALIILLISFWRITLIVISILFMAGILYKIYKKICRKRKHRLALKWINRCGMGQIPDEYDDDDFWKSMENNGLVKRFSRTYVISSGFYSDIIKKIDQQGIFTQTNLQQLCEQSASEFQSADLLSLSAFLEKNSQLFRLYLKIGDNYYLSPRVVSDCEFLFAKEGAATRNEFAQVCKEIASLYGHSKENKALSDFIIDRLMSKHDVNEVPLQNKDDYLYVKKVQVQGAKMIKREISLDDEI